MLLAAFVVVYPVFLATAVSFSFFIYAPVVLAVGLNTFISYKIANFFFFIFFFLYFFILVTVGRKALFNRATPF